MHKCTLVGVCVGGLLFPPGAFANEAKPVSPSPQRPRQSDPQPEIVPLPLPSGFDEEQLRRIFPEFFPTPGFGPKYGPVKVPQPKGDPGPVRINNPKPHINHYGDRPDREGWRDPGPYPVPQERPPVRVPDPEEEVWPPYMPPPGQPIIFPPLPGRGPPGKEQVHRVPVREPLVDLIRWFPSPSGWEVAKGIGWSVTAGVVAIGTWYFFKGAQPGTMAAGVGVPIFGTSEKPLRTLILPTELRSTIYESLKERRADVSVTRWWDEEYENNRDQLWSWPRYFIKRIYAQSWDDLHRSCRGEDIARIYLQHELLRTYLDQVKNGGEDRDVLQLLHALLASDADVPEVGTDDENVEVREEKMLQVIEGMGEDRFRDLLEKNDIPTPKGPPEYRCPTQWIDLGCIDFFPT